MERLISERIDKMRTAPILIAVGLTVALVAVVFIAPTAADQVVGPTSGTPSLASTGGVLSGGAMVLLVKGMHGGKGNFHGGSGNHNFHRWDRGYGRAYPGYDWDYDSSYPGEQTCVWNGYSYTCYTPTYPY